MASKYITAELQAALDNLAADQAQVKSLSDQLSAAKESYDKALASFDVETATGTWPKVAVLEEIRNRAVEAVRHIPAWAAMQSVQLARLDIRAAREKLENLVQVIGPRSSADEAVRRASTVGFSAVPSYARSAVETLSNWHREVAQALAELGAAEKLLIDVSNGRGDLDGVAGILSQAEAAVGVAGDVAAKASDVRAAVAQANSQYLEGVAS